LNSTQLLSVLLALNNLHHNGFVELAADKNQYDTKAFLAAMQWVLNHQPKELLAKEFTYKDTKDFFSFIGIPAQALDTNITKETLNIGIMKPELVGLGKKADVEITYRVPSHLKDNEEKFSASISSHSEEFLQRISIALNMVESGQPVLLVAKDAKHAIELSKQLSDYLNSKNIPARIDVFTGTESEEIRHQWFLENKLKQLKIAVTIPDLASNKEFNTPPSAQCLAIQAYMDEPAETKRIIDHLSSFGTSCHFVAIHEENRILSVLSHSLTSDKDKKLILESISANKQNRNQERAVEHFYLQSVTSIQRVALSQFDEWQAFLHLVYPGAEGKRLDKELLLVRQDFIKKMEKDWTKLLAATNRERAHPNPYIRRNANNTLDTITLDNAVKSYTVSVDTLWSSVRVALKDKAIGRIAANSVNELRSKYLEQADFQQLLVLDKLALREGIKTTQRDRKKASRLVKSALDVNGAMLKYAEGNANLYQQPFIDQQIRLLAQDICKQINLSSLSSKTKKILIERTLNADNLVSLELVLIDYEDRWSRGNRNSDKYRMQPVINEMLRIHQISGVAASDQLLVLKNIYLDNAANDIVEDLDHALSWARNENRGFWYFLERTAVQDAAIDILNAVDDVKYAADPVKLKVALKNLYSVLTTHQAQLDGMWIFSFGHKNIRDLINRTLYALNDLTVIGSGRDELSLDFINECKEEAQSNLAKQKFRGVINQLEERNKPWLRENKEWQEIISTLEIIQSENPSLYVIDEMHHFMSAKCNDLSQNKSRIIDPLIHLRGTLRSLWHDATMKHKELLTESVHLDLKREQIRQDLEKTPGYEVNSVELLAGTNGSREYYDLVIQGKGTLPLSDHFSGYDSQLSEMRHDRNVLESQLAVHKSQMNRFEQLINEQLSLISEGKWQQINVDLFPLASQEHITTVCSLLSYVSGVMPVQLDDFALETQNNFFDRELINSLDDDVFLNPELNEAEIQQMVQQIDNITNDDLKTNFKQLFYKIHPQPVDQKTSSSWWSPKPWISNLASRVFSTFSPQESVEDWRYDFQILKDIPRSYLTKLFTPQIKEKISALSSELEAWRAFEKDSINAINEQLSFIDLTIAEEGTKSGAIIRRFDSLDMLYEFENSLRDCAEKAPKVQVKVPKYENSGDDQFIHAEEIVGFDEDEIDSEEESVSSYKYH
ncbi:MAG: hypothetical protein M1486_05280, partial [Gammaproteobacteria bacterium]|nr:hypothetical protein [Gammaproteobacteria bacterium]